MQASSSGSRLKGWKDDDPRMQRVKAKRAAILDAACPIFLMHGWSGASLERVAVEGGFSKMTVYRHFGSKEELFTALIETMCRATGDQAEMEEIERLAPEVALDQLAREIVRGLTAPDALAFYRLIVADGWRFPALARLFEQSGSAVLRRRARDILMRAGMEGDEARQRASGFINLVLGDAYLLAALGIPDPDSDRRFERQIAAAIGFALAGPKGSAREEDR